MTIEHELELLSNTKNNIKAAINSKGVSVTDEPFSQYPNKIRAIQGVNNENITINTNGTYLPGTGYTGFGEVNVNVRTVNNEYITVNQNGTYTPSTGYTGIGQVIVSVMPPPTVTDSVEGTTVATDSVTMQVTDSVTYEQYIPQT